jgi:hypothetical protein
MMCSMNQPLKIEKNVPIPAGRLGRNAWAETIRSMKPGDSLVLPKDRAESFRTSSRYHGKKVIVRSISETEARVWIKP